LRFGAIERIKTVVEGTKFVYHSVRDSGSQSSGARRGGIIVGLEEIASLAGHNEGKASDKEAKRRRQRREGSYGTRGRGEVKFCGKKVEKAWGKTGSSLA